MCSRNKDSGLIEMYIALWEWGGQEEGNEAEKVTGTDSEGHSMLG